MQNVAYSEIGDDPPSRWLLESGCRLDLIDEVDVSPPDRANIMEADMDGRSLETCAGEVPVDRKVPLQSIALQKTSKP